MGLFWIKFAEKRGDTGFASIDLLAREDRRTLNLATSTGGSSKFGQELSRLAPVWDFSAPRPVPVPTGWAQFVPSGEAFVSAEMRDILLHFMPCLTWQEVPSLTGEISQQKWGRLDGFPTVDVLNKNGSAISSSGALWKPVLNDFDGALPELFHPAGTYAIFASEKAKKTMKKSGLTGFAFKNI